jgi:putative ABC transport system permease protein
MPDFKRLVRQRLELPPMKRRREEKIIEELALHLADLYREALSAGRSEDAALSHALSQVPDWETFASDITGAQQPNIPLVSEGDVENVEMSLRQRGPAWTWLADIGQDMRYALRALRSRPTFSLTAALVLALGIGAATAIFSVVETVLLRPLPFTEPDRLIFLLEKKLPQFPQFSVAPGNFLQWQAQNRTFDSMAAWSRGSFDLTGSDEPERLRGQRVTWNLFRLVGVRAVVGREFRADEDAPGAPPAAILSYELWRRRFGGDPSVVGRQITLNGIGHTVVGVVPSSMQLLHRDTALWVPMAFTEQQRQQYGSHYMRAIGRLKPGATFERAEADLDTVARRLEAEHPDADNGWRILPIPLREAFVRDVRPALLMLLGAVGLVLLVACANVANLFLVRGLGRRKELAIRSALGAGRARLVRQLLTESAAVALAGGATGLLLAHWLLRGLLTLVPEALPRAAEIGVSLPAVACALALSVLTPLVFGLLPSLQVSKADLAGALAAGGRTGHAVLRQRTRRLLIVTEMALAAVLLAGAGLLMRTVVRLTQVDPGFVAPHAVTASFELPPARYPDAPDAYRFYRELIDRVSHVPGVRVAGATAGLPFSDDYVTSITIEGRPVVPEADRPSANYYSVSPGYFEAMGIRLVRGRLFTPQDSPGARNVAIINETFAGRHFPGEDPLGKRIQVGMGSDAWCEVVGVVVDTRQYGLRQEATAQFYQPYGQLPFPGMTLVVRTDGEPTMAVPALREAVRAIDPAVPVGRVRTLEELLAESTAYERFSMLLLSAFAAAALFLAGIGLYGLLAYAVSQRKVEIGVRMAHGARPCDVLWMFAREGVGLALLGAAIGLAGAVALTHLIASQLFGVAPTDPATLSLVPAALVAAAVVASLVPAYRAVRTDVVGALRSE